MALRWMTTRLTSPAFREARSLTTAALLCATIRTFVLDQRTILSHSMHPTLEVGDRILVDKLSVSWGKLSGRPQDLGLRPGDMVVFRPPEASRALYAGLLQLARGSETIEPVEQNERHVSWLQQAWQKRMMQARSPLNPSLDFTKRVVALEGDRVGVRRGILFVNDCPETLLPRRITSGAASRASYSLDTVVVPRGHIMVFGDNRDGSFDSHAWGPLPARNVIGLAIARYWPFNRASWLGRGINRRGR